MIPLSINLVITVTPEAAEALKSHDSSACPLAALLLEAWRRHEERERIQRMMDEYDAFHSASARRLARAAAANDPRGRPT